MPILHHPQAAQHAAGDAGPKARILRDDADLGLGEAEVEVERRGERRRHAVAELVEKDERHAPAAPRDHPARLMNSRNGSTTASRSVCGGSRGSRLAHEQRHREPRQHEQRGDRGIPTTTASDRRGSAPASPGRGSRSGTHSRKSNCPVPARRRAGARGDRRRARCRGWPRRMQPRRRDRRSSRCRPAGAEAKRRDRQPSARRASRTSSRGGGRATASRSGRAAATRETSTCTGSPISAKRPIALRSTPSERSHAGSRLISR